MPPSQKPVFRDDKSLKIMIFLWHGIRVMLRLLKVFSSNGNANLRSCSFAGRGTHPIGSDCDLKLLL